MNTQENGNIKEQDPHTRASSVPRQSTPGNAATIHENKAPPSERHYTPLESAGAVCILVFSYLFIRSMPFGAYPLGNFIVCSLAVILCAVFFILKRSRSTSVLSYSFAAGALLFATAPLFCGQGLVAVLCYIAFAVCTAMFLYFSGGGILGHAKAEYLIYDVKRALISLPFSYGANALSAVIYPIRKGRFKSAGKQLGYILLGLAAALIPTVFVAVNLSFESAFTDLLDDIFGFGDIESIAGYALSAVYALPVALYLFSAVWQYRHGNDTEERKAAKEACDADKAKLRKIPALSMVSAAVPIMFMYAVFFISQIEEYTGAFTGVLPEGFNHAEYARSGFFELCRVSGLNALFIICSSILVRRRDNKPSAAVRVTNILLSICSLVLIATALAKMLFYINEYGMTQKRVYVALFMILMAVGFAAAIVSQLLPSLKMTWVCMALAALMLIIPAFSCIDGVIVSYNIDRYIEGTLDSVDYEAFSDYKEAAMPSLARLYKSEAATDADREEIRKTALTLRRRYDRESSVFFFSLPRNRAIQAADEILSTIESK